MNLTRVYRAKCQEIRVSGPWGVTCWNTQTRRC